MDAVFKALADPTRRSLLDELFREDGQTLSALEERLPMTRYGVMKHLRVLEEARLWEAITDSEMRQKYTFGVGIRSDWTAGSGYEAVHAAGGIRISEGQNLEVDPPRRLVQ